MDVVILVYVINAVGDIFNVNVRVLLITPTTTRGQVEFCVKLVSTQKQGRMHPIQKLYENTLID